MKKILSFLVLSLLLMSVFAWQGWERYQRFLSTPLNISPGGLTYVLDAGTTGSDIVQDLASMGLTSSGWEWRVLMRLEPHVYRTGEYQLDEGWGPRDVLEKLSSGDVIQYRFTIVEGWTFRQLLGALAETDTLRQELERDPETGKPINLFDLEQDHPEGLFLPETYVYTRGDSDLDILRRANVAMQDALSSAWESRDMGLPIETPYELLILASIIEKETSVDEERSRIAGVFIRRLNKRMRLQTDPTVIYGMGETFDGDIRRRDLKTDTPYNTYTRHGLPPTPIALPGNASLVAAGQPQEGDTLYFVADGNGGHTFSVTLEEHQAAVNKLIGRN